MMGRKPAQEITGLIIKHSQAISIRYPANRAIEPRGRVV